MKSSKDIAKAIAELQKLQATMEKIESEMKGKATLLDVEEMDWEQQMDDAYEIARDKIEILVEKAYEKDWATLLGIYEDAEKNLPIGGDEDEE